MKALILIVLTATCAITTAFAQGNADAEQKVVPQVTTTSKTPTRLELVEEAKRVSSGKSTSTALSATPIQKKVRIQTLAANDLYEPFAWILTAAQTFGDAGNGAVPAAQTSLQTETLGSITWESEHYWSNANQGYTPDFSFGGNIGITPTLVLVNLTNQGVAVPPNVRPMLQDAFGWNISPRLNEPIGGKGELSGLVTLGQTLLTTDVTSFKQGDNTTIVATRISNETGRAAMFAEYGAQFRLFSQADLFQTHLEKSYIIPAAAFSAGVRRDTRFKPAGDIGGYRHPEQRYFFRLFISLNKLMQKKQEGDTSTPFSVNFSVDYEAPRSDSRVPSATRFTISSDVDIMKLFHPSAP